MKMSDSSITSDRRAAGAAMRRSGTGRRHGKWSARGVAALACVLAAGSSVAGDAYRVYRAGETIGFEQHCVDAVAHQVQAWAHLESEGGRAHAPVLA